MSISIKSIYDWYRNTLRNPKYRWWLILGSLVYVLSPIDISPDFIPIAGQIDDLVVITLLMSEVSQMVIEFAKTRKSDDVASDRPTDGSKVVDVDAIPLDK